MSVCLKSGSVAFAAHAEVELGIDPDDLTNPWQAALSSALSFTVGALLPLIAILLPPTTVRIPVTVAAVLVALVVTGAVSASLGGAPKQRAITRTSSAVAWLWASPMPSDISWAQRSRKPFREPDDELLPRSKALRIVTATRGPTGAPPGYLTA